MKSLVWLASWTKLPTRSLNSHLSCCWALRYGYFLEQFHRQSIFASNSSVCSISTLTRLPLRDFCARPIRILSSPPLLGGPCWSSFAKPLAPSSSSLHLSVSAFRLRLHNPPPGVPSPPVRPELICSRISPLESLPIDFAKESVHASKLICLNNRTDNQQNQDPRMSWIQRRRAFAPQLRVSTNLPPADQFTSRPSVLGFSRALKRLIASTTSL